MKPTSSKKVPMSSLLVEMSLSERDSRRDRDHTQRSSRSRTVPASITSLNVSERHMPEPTLSKVRSSVRGLRSRVSSDVSDIMNRTSREYLRRFSLASGDSSIIRDRSGSTTSTIISDSSTRRPSRDWSFNNKFTNELLESMTEEEYAVAMNKTKFGKTLRMAKIWAPSERPEELDPKGETDKYIQAKYMAARKAAQQKWSYRLTHCFPFAR